MNNTKRPDQTPATSDGDGEYQRGPTGIDEARVLDALLRLEEVANEVGWVAVRRIMRELAHARRHRPRSADDAGPI